MEIHSANLLARIQVILATKCAFQGVNVIMDTLKIVMDIVLNKKNVQMLYVRNRKNNLNLNIKN
jgi:hypothetical protein